MWLLTNSPTWEAAAAPASTAAAHAADITADHRCDVRAADVDSLHNLHVGGLGHRVGRFDQCEQAFGFNQSNAFCMLFSF